jgi:hypothetical protein
VKIPLLIMCDNLNVKYMLKIKNEKIKRLHLIKIDKMITAKERAIMLYKNNTREYNRLIIKGKMQNLPENKEHWKEITQILTKLYKNEDKL